MMDPAKAAAPFLAAAQGGEAVAGVGNKALALGGWLWEEERKRETLVSAARIENELKKDALKVEEGFLSRRDFENFDADGERQIGELKQKYAGKTSGDGLLGAMVEKAIGEQEIALLGKIKAYKNKAMVEEGQGEFNRIYEQAVLDWVAAETPEKKEQVENMIELKAELFADGGILNGKQVEAYGREFRQKGYEAYFRGLVNSDAARAVKELKDKSVWGDFDPTKREILLASALDHERTEDSRKQAEKETAAYGLLHERFLGDPGKMREALLKPEVMKELGLTTTNARAIEATISDLEKQKRVEEDKVLSSWVEKDAKGQLTKGDILAAGDRVDPMKKMQWLNHLRGLDPLGSPTQQRISAAYSTLFSRHGGDAGKMREDLAKPETREELGLSAEMAGSVERSIGDLATVEVGRVKERLDEYSQMLTSRTLSAEIIAADVRVGRMLGPLAEEWKAKVRQQKDLGDPLLFSQLHDRLSRRDPDLLLSDITQAETLNKEEKSLLTNKFVAGVDKDFGEAETEAKKIVSLYIIATTDAGVRLMTPSTPGRMAKVYKLLDEWRAKFKASGRPFDNAAQQEYLEYANTIGLQNRTRLVDAMKEMQEAMGGFQRAGEKKAGGKKFNSIDEYEKATYGR